MSLLRKYLRSVIVLFIIWTAVGLTFSGVGYLAVVSENRSESILLILSVSLMRSYVWGLFSPLIFLFAKWLPIGPRGIRWRNVVGNLLLGLLVSLIYSLIFVGFGSFSGQDRPESSSAWAMIVQRVVVPTLYTVFSLFTPTFFTIQALLFYRNYKEESTKNASLKAELSTAQLNALKMQLQPHFLFNSLHSISSLILLDPKRANEMVALLGDFLRQTLEHSNDQMVALAEELEFLRCYLAIEQTRFEDRLSVDFDIEPGTLRSLVPHLILQPIVENAVKHGIAPYEAPGKITITAQRNGDDLHISVNDSGQVGNDQEHSDVTTNGVGISNVRSRLAHLFGDAAKVEINNLASGGCRVDIVIPGTSDDACEQ